MLHLQIYKYIILQNKNYIFVNLLSVTLVNTKKIHCFIYLSKTLINHHIKFIINKINTFYLANSNTYNIILQLILIF